MIKQLEQYKPSLNLGLQFFASDDNENDNNANNDASDSTSEGTVKTFTQAELEAIVKDRLAREKRKADEKAEEARKEAERKALEDQGKYKEMYEALQKDLAAKDAQVVEVRKQSLLLAAGYTQEQVDRFIKYLVGATDDEINISLETLKADIPPTGNYVDPSNKGNQQRQQQDQKDPYEYGKDVFARLKASGRIKK